MTFRFIHSSDLHLGRRFASIPQPEDGNIRGRLMEARHNAIARLAQAARANGAAHVLLAGDTFDTPTPSDSVLRQALAAMGEAQDVTWWLLPGNHDNLSQGEPLWDAIDRDAPGNVRPLRDAAPVDMAPGVTLLPCPVTHRRGATDPTLPLVTMPSDEGTLRIGLAHGGVTDFDDNGGAIAPDRDTSGRLDYLALGDWHGRMQVSPRVQYCGSPEQDQFKHPHRGVCLLVEIDGPGAVPQVSEVTTGRFWWTHVEMMLTRGQEIETSLNAVLPDAGRRDTLVQLSAHGWAGLAEQADLRRAAAQVAPEFAWLDLRTGRLQTQVEPDDLDAIDTGGALRRAADSLAGEARADTLAQTDRDVAGDALARLYAYVQEGGE